MFSRVRVRVRVRRERYRDLLRIPTGTRSDVAPICDPNLRPDPRSDLRFAVVPRRLHASCGVGEEEEEVRGLPRKLSHVQQGEGEGEGEEGRSAIRTFDPTLAPICGSPSSQGAFMPSYQALNGNPVGGPDSAARSRRVR
jgi:hypothetical protein